MTLDLRVLVTDFVVHRTPPLGRVGRAYAVIVATPPDEQTVHAEAYLFFTREKTCHGRRFRYYTTFAFPPLVVDESFIAGQALRWLEGELLEAMITADDPMARPADAVLTECDAHELYFLGIHERCVDALSWIRRSTRSLPLRAFVDRVLDSAPLQGDTFPPADAT
ncbi:MAG: hypothetical protein HY084_11915 [Gemmatimonadetes bacterium]|nr:hypothetical protein [Gemmatimonadota bacterium]